MIITTFSTLKSARYSVEHRLRFLKIEFLHICAAVFDAFTFFIKLHVQRTMYACNVGSFIGLDL